MTDKICKVVYINLKHRTDRDSQILTELRKVFPENKIHRQEAVHTPRHGGIGCLASHIAVLRYAIKYNLENILIVEDDFIFTVSKDIIEEKLNKLFGTFNLSASNVTLNSDTSNLYVEIGTTNIHVDFDICMFVRNVRKFEAITDSIDRVYDAQTTACYLIKKKMYATLLKNFEEAYGKLIRNISTYNVNAADQTWKKLMSSHVFICFNPALGKQAASFSDISNKIENYNC